MVLDSVRRLEVPFEPSHITLAEQRHDLLRIDLRITTCSGRVVPFGTFGLVSFLFCFVSFRFARVVFESRRSYNEALGSSNCISLLVLFARLFVTGSRNETRWGRDESVRAERVCSIRLM